MQLQFLVLSVQHTSRLRGAEATRFVAPVRNNQPVGGTRHTIKPTGSPAAELNSSTQQQHIHAPMHSTPKNKHRAHIKSTTGWLWLIHSTCAEQAARQATADGPCQSTPHHQQPAIQITPCTSVCGAASSASACSPATSQNTNNRNNKPPSILCYTHAAQKQRPPFGDSFASLRPCQLDYLQSLSLPHIVFTLPHMGSTSRQPPARVMQ